MKNKTVFLRAGMILLTVLFPGNVFLRSEADAVKKDNPCRIVFGWSEAESRTPLLDWMKKGGYAWGIELLHNVPEEAIRKLHQQGWNIILYQLSHPETVTRYYHQKKRAVPDVDAVAKKFLRATDGKAIWQLLLEDESCGVGFAQELMRSKPKSHGQAYAMLDGYLRKAIDRTLVYGDRERWGVAGYAATAHLYAKQPEIDLLSIERANDDVDDLQTGIAFYRGAARQYHKIWGVDLSLWWGGIYGCVQDLPYLYHKRHLFVSWYAGAGHFRIEGSELFFDKTTLRPNRITQCLDEFGAFIQTHERGEILAPVAVVLPEDHGWMTPPYWSTQATVWNYARIPYRQGQKALDGFFTAAFPGSTFYMDPFSLGKFATETPPASPFALSSISPEFAPNPADVFSAEYPVPFGRYENRKRAGMDLAAGQVETSPYRPMGDSRWGDIFDVFTTRVSEKVLSRYKVVVLLDQVEMDSALIAKLQYAMAGGSTVLCAAGVLQPEHAEWIGAGMDRELRVGQAWAFSGEKMNHEPFRYIRARLTDGKARAVTLGDWPILIEKSHGKGKLISCMIPWFEGIHAGLSGAVWQLLDRVMAQVQPAVVNGPPIAYLTTKSAEAVNVVLSNNSDRLWQGAVALHAAESDMVHCQELLTREKISFTRNPQGAVVADMKVPPYEVRVLSWSR